MSAQGKTVRGALSLLLLGPFLMAVFVPFLWICLLYTSPSPRDRSLSRMPSSA